MQELLSLALKENHLDVGQDAQQKLLQYLHLLKEWNQVFNLTTIIKPRDMVYLHIIDSLIVQPFIHGKRLLDVGSGAGLPGIPLAIVNPELEWVLLDKSNKKTRFLTQVIAELSLRNATAIHSRCEQFHPEARFDSILSRAFGTISMFVTTTEHLLCPDGNWIAMKGKFPQDEVNNLPDRFVVEQSRRLEIIGMTVERHIVCLRKKIAR